MECIVGNGESTPTIESGSFTVTVNTDPIAVDLGKRPKLLFFSDSQSGEATSVGTSRLTKSLASGNTVWTLIVTDIGFTAKLTVWSGGNTDKYTGYYWAIM